MLTFACLSPHPPIILPTIGSSSDREKVKSTISALKSLIPDLTGAKPDLIIISSPHPDWGFEVPLYYLAKGLKFKMLNYQSISEFQFSPSSIVPFITTFDSPSQHFKWGKEIIKKIPKKTRIAWIASGDMSHRLSESGPYGFHPLGPKFDQKFIELLKEKEIKKILRLYPEPAESAAECGLRSFSLLLGALEEEKKKWKPEILSYEAPFGVGYLVAKLYG